MNGWSANLVGMRSILVFGSVGGVAEGLATTRHFARVGFFSRVRSQMCLQVLQAAVGLGAALELNRTSR